MPILLWHTHMRTSRRNPDRASSPNTGLVPPRKRTLAIAASLFIASCEGTVTTDLFVASPADPDIRQIVVPFVGIEFRRDDGSISSIELNTAESLDLMDLAEREPLRLLTEEELPAGTYTGLRLIFTDADRDDAYLIDGIGGARELTISEGSYAETAFAIEEDERSNESLTLALDLRLSISASDRRYQFSPVIRAMHADDAGTIEGTVRSACLTNATARSPAVYLFQGEDVSPDDFGRSGAQPFATAPVIQTSDEFSYELRFIPEGRYTIAFVCRGDREDPTSDDDIEFRATRNVRLNEAQTLRQNLSG
jgi:hypothetical protein